MTKKRYIIICSTILLLVVTTSIVVLLVKRTAPKARYVRQKPNPKLCEHPDGIDLSHHNVAYNWNKVDAKFVYIRATMGNRIIDKRYDSHKKAAQKHRIPIGAYHFLEASSTAEDQFGFFSFVVKPSDIQLRPMLDVEESDYWDAPKGFTDDDAHRLIRSWCNLCKKKYGIAPIIYVTEKLYQRYKLNQGFSDCIWWIANYNKIGDFEKKCSAPFTLHQYSNRKYVEGFYGPIDCNRFRKGKSVEDLYIRQ